ncbi:DUF3343 domain-containing protein [Geobacter chapellei]|uniref:DUF3343 domain-containing protein n=1 Tax=Pelotalea chapellei TaxID=44671 RepID=A0ABS5UBK1_9BACT|nr:DUF3343 domain-containing protein [Pelotalea chapellei]MBT1073069.1 DUF3343 domain-containing protein [Pelotalea chapellei]
MVREGNLLAVFNSTHRVMKAESILKSLGLPVLLIPAPRQLLTDCGLAIRFTEEDRVNVLEAMEREHILPEFITRLEAGHYVTTWPTSKGKDKKEL